jgi:hypothetical protein
VWMWMCVCVCVGVEEDARMCVKPLFHLVKVIIFPRSSES